MPTARKRKGHATYMSEYLGVVTLICEEHCAGDAGNSTTSKGKSALTCGYDDCHLLSGVNCYEDSDRESGALILSLSVPQGSVIGLKGSYWAVFLLLSPLEPTAQLKWFVSEINLSFCAFCGNEIGGGADDEDT